MRTLVFLLFYLVSNSLISQNNTPYIDYSGSINLVENQISKLSVVAFDDDVIQLINNPHIIVLGSSTAAGTGASAGNGWVWQFDEYLSGFDIPYTLTNLSVSGYNSYHFIPSGYAPPGRPNPDLTRNITHALALDPDIIVVNLPSNDVANGFSAQETYNNFHIIDSIATAQGVSVFFTTTQPRNFSNLSTRQELKIKADTILSRYGSKAISLYDELSDPNFRIKSIYHSGDGIHLNDLGHTYIFRQVADILYPFLFDGDSITFSMTGNPGFAQLTDYGDRTAEIILSPGGNSAGIYDFTLTATDANNNSFDETIHLIINEFGHVGGTQALESFDYTINGGGKMDYYVYYPQNFDANPSNWPVLISLHGNAERGGSSTKLVQSEGEGSLAKLLHDGAQLPFMVISPHMSAFIGGVYQPGWNIDALEELVDHIKVEYDIDSTRIYMTGFSAGGAATWLYLVNNPDQIAAATVLAGLSNLAEGNLQQAPYPCLIKEIPIKVWHGDQDNVVNISHSTNMVNAINSCDPAPDPEVELIIPNGVGHDELRTMVHADFTSPNNMYDWFLSFSLDSVFDLKPPGFVSAPEIVAGSDFATITAEIDEPGKIYFGLYEYGSVPSVEDILTSTGSGFVDGGVSDSRFLDHTFQDLTNFTIYDAWVIAQDLANPPNLQQDPVLVQFTTFSDTLPPTMQSGPQVEVSTGALSVNFRTNEPGNVYWALLGDLDVDVTSHQLQQLSVGIQHGQKSIGSNLESLEVTGLAKESTYNFLMTIDDVEGNLSDSVYQFEFTTLPVETTVGASTVINLNLINSTSSNLDEWNDINVTGFSGYKSFNNLLDEDGNETGVSFTAINGVQASSIVGVANNNSSLANGVFPDEVLQYAAYTTGGANFYFEGLDPTIEYSVQLHGGRSGSGSRLTSFTVQGESQQLECINNNTEVVTFDEVFSNGNGRIDIQFSKINSSWAYMNAIVISEMIEEIDTFPPGVPSNLSAILQGNQIMINWDDNLETDFHSYSIYITADSGLPGSGDLIVNGLTQSEYEYDPIQPINYIWVSSVDNTGNESSLSGPILISTEPIDNTPPSAPVINELTVIGIDSIYLSWTGGGEADLSGYNVYRSQSSGFPLTVSNLVTTSTGTSYTDIGLEAGTGYYYVLTALDTAGNESVGSAEAYGQTASPVDNTPPSAPVINELTVIGIDSIYLSWTGGGEADLSGYNVYRSQSSGFPLTVANLVTTTTGTSYTDIGLEAGTGYYYVLTALDTAGNESVGSAEAYGQTASPVDNTPPSAPVINELTVIGIDSIYLSWTGGGEADLSGYNVYRSQSSGFPLTVSNLVTTSTGTSYTDIGLEAGTGYYYVLTALDTAGNESVGSAEAYGQTASPVDNTPPSAPVINELTVIGIDSIYLSWTGGGEADLSGYNVYRSQSSGFPLTVSNLVTTTTGTSYTDIGLEAGTGYYYVLTALDTAGNESVGSAEAYGQTASPVDNTPPSAPVINELTVIGIDSIYLSWTGGGEADLSGYNVYRSQSSGFPLTVSNLVTTSTGTSYTDIGLEAGTGYYYVLTALDTAGNESVGSAEAYGQTASPVDNTPPSAPVINELTVIGIDSIYLSWTGGGEADLSGYNVYRSQSSGFPLTVSNLVTTATGTSYTDIGLEAGTGYYYVLTALDTAGNESVGSAEADGQTASPVDNTPPSAPVINELTVIGIDSIYLSWTGGGEADLSGYNVYRSQSSGFPLTVANLVTTTTGTSYTDIGLEAGTGYYYVLTALDTAGNESVGSAEAYGQTNTPTTSNTILYKINIVGNQVSALPDWNAVNFQSIPTRSIRSFSITDVTGVYSDITVNALNGINASSILGVVDNGSGLNGGIFPDQVVRYGAYTSGGGKIILSDLNQSSTYTITILGGRSGSGSRMTNYIVQGESQLLECINNNENTVVFEGINADSNNEISIDFEKTSSWAYINAILVNENQNNSSARVSDTVNEELTQIVSLDPEISIYPNPAQNRLKITTPFEVGSDLSIKLVDINGRIVYQKELKQTQLGFHEIELADVSAGVYQLLIFSNEIDFSRKLMITK